MRGLTRIACAAAAFAGYAVAIPLVASPGGVDDIIIDSEDTLNATTPAPTTSVSLVVSAVSTVSAGQASTSTTSSSAEATSSVHVAVLASTDSTTTTDSEQLAIAIDNKLDSDDVHAYVTGLDPDGALVMLQPDGAWFYPTCNSTSGVPEAITGDVAISIGGEGSTTTITLPTYITSGRVYFAVGYLDFYTVESTAGVISLVEPSAVNPDDPSADVNWGFVELTNDDDGLYVNLSFVDFTGLPLGITLTDTSGNVYTAYGLVTDGVAEICAELAEVALTDGTSWGELCMYSTSGAALRVLSPYDYLAGINTSAFEDYWTTYVDDVWTYYTTHNLTIDTQASEGDVNCSVSSTTGNLTCVGDNRGYEKPTAADIFGCNAGPFEILDTDNTIHYAVVPRLCAAFHRSELLLVGGNVQPGLSNEYYYTVDPTNWYSSIVHSYQIDGKGYAFPYDDVTPTDGVDESGLLSSTDPDVLTIIVGGSC